PSDVWAFVPLANRARRPGDRHARPGPPTDPGAGAQPRAASRPDLPGRLPPPSRCARRSRFRRGAAYSCEVVPAEPLGERAQLAPLEQADAAPGGETADPRRGCAGAAQPEKEARHVPRMDGEDERVVLAAGQRQ